LALEAVGGVGDGYKNRLNEYDDDHSQDYGQCGLWGRGKAFDNRHYFLSRILKPNALPLRLGVAGAGYYCIQRSKNPPSTISMIMGN